MYGTMVSSHVDFLAAERTLLKIDAGLLLLIPLTHLKLDWINFGTVKVVVKCCVRNFNNLIYCEVISRYGHRGFGLRSSTPSTSTSDFCAVSDRL